MRFAGKTVFITGGGSGIGAACARRFAAEGACVAVADLSLAHAQTVSEALGNGSFAVELDVRHSDSCDSAVVETLSRTGRLDVAVNCAGVGIAHPSELADLTDEEWHRVVDVNLTGVFRSMRSELSAMVPAGSGVIVNIASIMGMVGALGSNSYVAAKHGVIGLTKAVAIEYASRGIRVNSVAPGHVRTPMFDAHSVEWQESTTAKYPMGRVAEPEEIASVVVMLASDDASFTNGANFAVDGGYTAA